MRDVLFGTRSALPGIQMAKGASEMFGGHLPELLILLVMLLVLIGAVWGIVWVFGLAVGRGIARCKGR